MEETKEIVQKIQTWGVKVPDDLKIKLDEAFSQSGLKGAEFADALLQSYKIQYLKEHNPAITADIEELQTLINRIYIMYAAMGDRVENILKAKEITFEERISEKNEILRTFDGRIKELENLLQAAIIENESFKNQLLESQRRNKELDEISETNKFLVKEYKDKNDTLSGFLKDYKESSTVIEGLKKELEEERDGRKIDSIRIGELEREITNLEKNSEIQESKHIAEIKHLEMVHDDDIKRVTQQTEIEKDKAILALKDEHQQKTENIRNSFNLKIEALLDKIENKNKPATTGEKKQKSSDKKAKESVKRA